MVHVTLRSERQEMIGRWIRRPPVSKVFHECPTRRTICLLFGVTNRIADSGCVVPMVPGRVQPHGQVQWREHQSLDSCFWSLNSVFLAKGASVLPDHPHFFPTETCVLDRHAEEQVFVFLVVGGKGVLVEQNVLRVVRAHPCKVRELLPYGSDQIRFPLHTLVIGHRAIRIADSERRRIPQMSGGSEGKVKL